MKPLKDYVLVKEAKEEATTESGLILTGNVEKGSKPGIVEAVGPDVKDVKIGDKIALAWEKGMRVKQSTVLVSEEFILGIY